MRFHPEVKGTRISLGPMLNFDAAEFWLILFKISLILGYTVRYRVPIWPSSKSKAPCTSHGHALDMVINMNGKGRWQKYRSCAFHFRSQDLELRTLLMEYFLFRFSLTKLTNEDIVEKLSARFLFCCFPHFSWTISNPYGYCLLSLHLLITFLRDRVWPSWP